MGYATQADLEQRFGAAELIQLTDRAEPPAGAVDGQVVARALADADALIDSYLAARYDLPLATPPALLVGLACDVARYQLYDDAAPEEVRRRYEDALARLKQLATGVMVLDVGGQEAPPRPSTMVLGSAPRTFSRDTLRGW